MEFMRGPAVIDTVGFVIIGQAVPKQGSKSRLVTSAQGVFTQHYTPEHVTNWAAYVKMVASQYQRVPLWDGPIRAFIQVERVRPKSKKNAIYCDTKPDLDNIEKNLFDALHGVIYTNDSRIVEKYVRKVYSDVEQTTVRLDLLS